MTSLQKLKLLQAAAAKKKQAEKQLKASAAESAKAERETARAAKLAEREKERAEKAAVKAAQEAAKPKTEPKPDRIPLDPPREPYASPESRPPQTVVIDAIPCIDQATVYIPRLSSNFVRVARKDSLAILKTYDRNRTIRIYVPVKGKPERHWVRIADLLAKFEKLLSV